MRKAHEGNVVSDFVPIARLSSSLSPPPLSQELVASLATRLESFSADLTLNERVALMALLDVARKESPVEELAASPSETVLDVAEREVFARIVAEPQPIRSDFRSSLV